MAFQRVRKADAKADTFVQPDQVDYCLDCWRSRMWNDPDRDLGIKTMGGLRGLGDAYGRDEGEAQLARDNRIAAATDAMIDSLCRLHIWAIYKAIGIGQVWSFPQADLAQTYAEARVALEAKLRGNVCTGVLF